MASEIRGAALKRGYDGDGDGRPDAQGVCGSTNATIQKDFGNACLTLKQNNDKVDTNATLANVGVGIAIVGGVFATAWLIAVPLVNRKREQSGTGTINIPTLRPYAGPNNGGFVLSGSF